MNSSPRKQVAMIWQPLNLTEMCSADTQLSACSSFGYVYLNLLVYLFGDAKDTRIQESLRAECPAPGEPREEEQYDFIVVGAGAAGCVVASRLSEVEDWKVLLLEAGPEQPDVTLVPGFSDTLKGSSIDWKYKSEPNGNSCLAYPEKRCTIARGKVMGGSSSINSLTYIRGNRVDYDGWAAEGNDGWSYEDVLPYFKKSERNLNAQEGGIIDPKYHGQDGELTIRFNPYVDIPSTMITDAFVERGLPLRDFNGEEQEGTMQAQTWTDNGQRVSSYNAFIQPIRYKRPNLIVKPNSEVVKIQINTQNSEKAAYGVKYINNGKTHVAKVRKEVIVSAGPIGSPKLLMLSGIGPKEHLEELNIHVIVDVAVGYNLHEHLSFYGIIIALPNGTATTVSHVQVIKDIFDYYKADVKEGPLSANGPFSSIAFIKTDPNGTAPDIQFQVDRAIWKEYVQDPATYSSLNILPTPYYDGLLPKIVNLKPKSRGRLTLNLTHSHAEPLISMNYLSDPRDFIPLIRGVKFLISLENTDSFKERGARLVKIPLEGCKEYDWGSDGYITCLAKQYTAPSYHLVGTCKMGPCWDEDAVVDPSLRVYGITGLRVIDSSIMPVVPSGNTNAPSIMVGERGVALVIEDWQKNITTT